MTICILYQKVSGNKLRFKYFMSNESKLYNDKIDILKKKKKFEW